MNRFNEESFKPIDQEEKVLMASIERDDWKPVQNLKNEKKDKYGVQSNSIKSRLYKYPITSIALSPKHSSISDNVC